MIKTIMEQVKDYKLIQKTDDSGNIYYEGEITRNKTEIYKIYVCEEGKKLLESYKWCIHKNTARNTGYLKRAEKLNRKHITIHFHRQLINCPSDMEVDHINRNGLDNRLSNLRSVTRKENHQNRNKRKNTLSKYIGVTFDKIRNKWSAKICPNNKTINLGRFDSENEAALAYNYAAEKIGYLHQNNNNI